MREIKFRVWDGNRYITKSDIYEDENDKCLILELDGSLIDIAYDREDDYTNEYIIEQFTGLHDKNGVEIYEGDVVKVRKISIDDKLYEAKVLFQQIGRSGFAYSIDYKDDNGTLFYGLQEQKYIEVIGNIHEEVVE